MMTDKTLLEQMRINEIEIFHRMQLLDLSQDELDLIASLKKLIKSEIEGNRPIVTACPIAA